MASDRYRARCVDCKKVALASSATRWCDNCGGELKRIPYGRKKGARGGRR